MSNNKKPRQKYATALPQISKEELLDAIRDGVNDAMPISKRELLGAIREGVYDAVWQMITNATSMPCHDFFDTVREGIADGIERAQVKNRDNGTTP
jgi:hypothetical protein